jgi:hypothetical protein
VKKNIIGHMTAPKATKKGLWRKLDLFARLLCLILALLIWLFVVNVYHDDQSPEASTPEAVTTAAA